MHKLDLLTGLYEKNRFIQLSEATCLHEDFHMPY
ncbi:MAG: hypothetical protein ACI8QD_000067, partial [Cyclobacteriaceae bacterium]